MPTSRAELRPMLATKGIHVPADSQWIHEVKWDGMRVLVHTGPDGTIVRTRGARDVSPAFPELSAFSAALAMRDAVIDGEACSMVDGRPAFSAIAERVHLRDSERIRRAARARPAVLFAFDLLYLDGVDLRKRPLRERRSLLSDLVEPEDRWQVPPAYEDGAMLFHATKDQRLEGIVSKRLESRYRPGERSKDWLKFPHRETTSYVVGGWRPETGSEHRLGALLVGTPTPGGLLYRGRVGSGIAGKVGPVLAELLAPLAATRSPFADEVPRIDATGTRWVHPQLVVDVESLGVNGDPTVSGSRLRQPAYRGVRTDLDLGDL